MSATKNSVTTPEGPSLDALLRRLLEIPTDFLLDADTSTTNRQSPSVNVIAVAHDVVASMFSGTAPGLESVGGSAVDSGFDATLRGQLSVHSQDDQAQGDSSSIPSYLEARTQGREAVNGEALERFEAALHNDRQGRAAGFALLFAWLLADPWFHRFAGKRVSQKRVWSTFTTLAVAHAAESSAVQWHGDPKRREEIVRSMLATLELIPEGETEAQADDRLTRVSSAQRKRLLAAAREAEARAEVVREALAAKAAQEAADKYTRE
jgi:hypothetical protein